jgi:hypothetical protein
MTQISQNPPSNPERPRVAALKVTVVPDDGSEQETFWVWGIPRDLPINLVELIGCGTVFEHGFDVDTEFMLLSISL